MSVSLTTTITPIVDPGVPNNDGTVDTLPSTYQLTYFEANILFQAIDDILETPVAITNVTCTIPYPPVALSLVSNNPFNYTVKVSGAVPSGTFPETFSFVLQDGTLVTSTGNVSNMSSIYEWSPPNVRIINTTYPFVITVSGVGNVNKSINQYIYWNLEPSLASFEQLVSIGK